MSRVPSTQCLARGPSSRGKLQREADGTAGCLTRGKNSHVLCILLFPEGPSTTVQCFEGGRFQLRKARMLSGGVTWKARPASVSGVTAASQPRLQTDQRWRTSSGTCENLHFGGGVATLMPLGPALGPLLTGVDGRGAEPATARGRPRALPRWACVLS